MISLVSRKKVAVALARRAAAMIRPQFTLGATREWKSDNSPVTATDKAVNHMIVKALTQHFPEDSIISEEELPTIQHNSPGAWVIDPIDGTVPFSHGIPTFCVSIAYVVNGAPVIGVIIDPILKREFVGVKGKGTTLNGARLQIPPITLPTSRQTIACGRHVLVHLLPAFVKKRYTIMSLYSATYEAMFVATGAFSFSIYRFHNPWDIAAVKIIVEEAGGVVRDLRGREQRYDQKINGAIMANRDAYPTIVRLTRQYADRSLSPL